MPTSKANPETLLELYQKLGVAEEQSCSEEGRLSHAEMMQQLRKALYG